MIILAFTQKEFLLYFAKATMISVGKKLRKNLQLDMLNHLLKQIPNY